MASDQTLNHEYLPVEGNPDYRNDAVRLLLGEQSPAILASRVGVHYCTCLDGLRLNIIVKVFDSKIIFNLTDVNYSTQF